MGLQGVYHSSEKLSSKGLNSRGILKLIKNLIPILKNEIHESLSDKIIDQLKFPSKEKLFVRYSYSKE